MKNNAIIHSIYRVLLGVICGCFLLGEVANVTISNASVSFFELSVGVFVIVNLVIGYKDMMKMITKPSTKIIMPLLIFMVVSLIFVYFSVSTRIFSIDFMYTVRFLLFFFFYLSILFGISKNIITTKHIVNILILLGFGIAVLGLLQYIFIPDTRFLFSLGWDEHFLRLISTLLDPPFAGAIIAVSLLIFHQRKLSITWFLGLIVFLSSILLTYSRATYIALAISLAFLLLAKRKLQTFLTLMIFLAFIPFLPRPASEGTRLERVASIEARSTEFQKTVYELRLPTLVYGNGWYVTKASRQAQNGILTSHSSSPDNSYLHILESFGFLGMIPICYFLIKAFRLYKNLTGYAIFICILTASVVNNVLFYPWIMAMIWLTYILSQPTEDM